MLTVPSSIQEAAQAIRQGKLVVFPTETVYGVGADATNSAATLAIFELKARPHFNPLIVHVASLEAARHLVSSFPADAEKLAARFWPGPLTLVLPKGPAICDFATSGLDTVAVRVPQHPVALELLSAANVPIAAPSANFFSALSPTRLQDVSPELLSRVASFLEGGGCEVGVESTIVQVENAQVTLLRPGGVSREAIEACLGKPLLQTGTGKIRAPGMMNKHYAPNTPLYFNTNEVTPNAALITFGSIAPARKAQFTEIVNLSPESDMRLSAKQLFSELRRLDKAGYRAIYADRFLDQGLGVAINDRLKRASVNHQP